jgi:hypothetical protein
MNKSLRLVKLLVQPCFLVEDENGVACGEVSSQQSISIYANDLYRVREVLNEVQDKVAADVLTPKS